VGALVEQKRGPRSPHANFVSPEIEQKILDYCLQRPTHGAARVANELRLQGVTVSAGGVRGVRLRHDRETSSGCCAWRRPRARTRSCSRKARLSS